MRPGAGAWASRWVPPKSRYAKGSNRRPETAAVLLPRNEPDSGIQPFREDMERQTDLYIFQGMTTIAMFRAFHGTTNARTGRKHYLDMQSALLDPARSAIQVILERAEPEALRVLRSLGTLLAPCAARRASPAATGPSLEF